jgi:hypothetical protein
VKTVHIISIKMHTKEEIEFLYRGWRSSVYLDDALEDTTGGENLSLYTYSFMVSLTTRFFENHGFKKNTVYICCITKTMVSTYYNISIHNSSRETVAFNEQ